MKNNVKSKNVNSNFGYICNWISKTNEYAVRNEDEIYLLTSDGKFNEDKEDIQYEDEYQNYKEEIDSLFEKRKLFFIVLFKNVKLKFYIPYIKNKFYLSIFEKSFLKRLSVNEFTLFSIGFINEFQSNVFKRKKFFKYFTYTTM